ncbi:hypothetical protein N7931_13870 [Catenovulum sp. 2E275]|uniref:hypothetical protein n=1 Tax=Catenovulum sp. 2E275 TaxID=2980497 RepID=UPI0021D385AB|nr:hypothetical protein [Catenovulum sp. 2E275]MCU4676719.1 hypothetical protein [Catenovulum sp. 2E275]
MLNVNLSIKIAFITAILALLQACDNNKLTVQQPGEVAIEFFDAIYNQQDLNAAVKLTTPQYSRILKSYYTVERVQKVLFNRRYDKVEIEEDTNITGLSFTDTNADKAYVTLMFDGLYNGERFRDLKKIVMVKQQGKWRVDKLKADVYR